MIEFKNIDISDRDRINSALMQSDFMGCEYSFANNLAWCRLAGSRICFYKDFYIICAFETDDGIPCFSFPSGKGDYREVFSEMKKYAESLGKPLRVGSVTDNGLKILNELFPDSFSYRFQRGSSDYIYSSADLINLSGKKYHSKRNHLKKFSSLDYSFSLITEKDFDECIVFCTNTYNQKNVEDSHSLTAEQYAINTYFSYFRELGLQGGIIRTEKGISAVTIGERLNSETYCVHTEKADTSFEGIYAGINNLFAKACMSDFKYVNREEDMGIQGLRKSKLSYHPVFLLNKYTADFK